MMKAKTTKRALLMSVLALLLCCSMLIGSTYAWFTDTATSGGNIIKSGTLDVALLDAEGNSLEGEMIEWAARDGRAQEEIFWEPNCTYKTEEFYVVNNGNLNLKFQIALADVTGDVKLLEVIDFTAMTEGEVTVECPWGWYTTTQSLDVLNGSTIDMAIFGETYVNEFVLEPGEKFGPIVLEGHMDKNAGNEYQNLTLQNLAVSVLATQAIGEEDSYDGMYDASTTVNYVSTEEELIEAMTKDGVVALTNDIYMHDVLNVTGTVTLDLAGHTLGDDDDFVFYSKGGDTLICVKYGAGLTVNDSVGTGAIIADSDYHCGIKLTNTGDVYAGEPAKLVVNGGTITSHWYGIVGNGGRDNTEVTINGGNITGGYAALHNPQNGTVTINGGTLTGVYMPAYESVCATNGYAVVLYSGSLTINGGTFNGATDVMDIQNKNSGGYEPIEEININAGLYNGTGVYTMDEDGNETTGDLSDFVAEDYHVLQNGENYQVISEDVDAIVSTSEDLVDALKNGESVALSEDITLSEMLIINDDVNVVLDLNGQEITYEDQPIAVRADASLTLKNGTVNTASDALGIFGNGQIYAENVIFNAKYCFGMNGSTTTENSKAEFVDCEFHITSGYTAAYISAKGTYTFKNCVLEGGTGVLIRSGNVTLDSCTIIANGYMGKGNVQDAVYVNYVPAAESDVVKDGNYYWGEKSSQEGSVGDCVTIIENSGSGYDLKSVTIKNCKFQVVNTVEVDGETVTAGYAIRYFNKNATGETADAVIVVENNTDMEGNAIEEGTLGLVYSKYTYAANN